MTPQTLSVLVIDDDAGDAEILRRHLWAIDEYKIVLHHAVSAQFVYQEILQHQPDVVFIDFLLGEKTGLDIVSKLRQRGDQTPIIMLTAYGNETVVKDCLISGADDYLSKNALAPDALRRALQNAQAQSMRRKAEAKLLLIQFALENASDPIFWVAVNGHFTLVNKAACNVTRYSREDFQSITIAEIMSSVSPHTWPLVWERSKQAGTFTFEDRLRTKDGSFIPVEIRLDYLEFQDNQCICAFVRDLSERKRAEAALRAKEERAHHQQRLEAIGTLAGGAAHEFNNLLQVIEGFTICALGGLTPQSVAHADLQNVLAATQRAILITRQLLDLSRREPIVRVLCDLNAIVRNESKLLAPLLNSKIKMDVQLEAIGQVFADPTMIEQLIMNLCVNARDAMPAGGKLLIKTENNAEGDPFHDANLGARSGAYQVLIVSDTGCGMTDDVKARIFEPFFTTKTAGKGTGLGLAMAQRSVEQNGGTIRVFSDLGRGTTFKIYLPMTDIQSATDPLHGENTTVPTADPARGATLDQSSRDESVVSLCSNF